jgi:hypothetical protein
MENYRQEVILRAMTRKITSWQAAEITGNLADSLAELIQIGLEVTE